MSAFRDEDKGSQTLIDKYCALHNNNNSTFLLHTRTVLLAVGIWLN